MSVCKVKLNAIGDIRNFVNAASDYDSQIEAVSGRHIVNAKSLMGIFSLDLSKPVELHVHGDNTEGFFKAIRNWLVQ